MHMNRKDEIAYSGLPRQTRDSIEQIMEVFNIILWELPQSLGTDFDAIEKAGRKLTDWQHAEQDLTADIVSLIEYATEEVEMEAEELTERSETITMEEILAINKKVRAWLSSLQKSKAEPSTGILFQVSSGVSE